MSMLRVDVITRVGAVACHQLLSVDVARTHVFEVRLRVGVACCGGSEWPKCCVRVA